MGAVRLCRGGLVLCVALSLSSSLPFLESTFSSRVASPAALTDSLPPLLAARRHALEHDVPGEPLGEDPRSRVPPQPRRARVGPLDPLPLLRASSSLSSSRRRIRITHSSTLSAAARLGPVRGAPSCLALVDAESSEDLTSSPLPSHPLARRAATFSRSRARCSGSVPFSSCSASPISLVVPDHTLALAVRRPRLSRQGLLAVRLPVWRRVARLLALRLRASSVSLVPVTRRAPDLTHPPLALEQHSGKYTDLAQDTDGNYGGGGAQRILSGGGGSTTTTGGPSMAGSPARTGPGPDLGGPSPGMMQQQQQQQPQMTSVEQGRVGESV